MSGCRKSRILLYVSMKNGPAKADPFKIIFVRQSFGLHGIRQERFWAAASMPSRNWKQTEQGRSA